jgi:hypothetical protein
MKHFHDVSDYSEFDEIADTMPLGDLLSVKTWRDARAVAITMPGAWRSPTTLDALADAILARAQFDFPKDTTS